MSEGLFDSTALPAPPLLRSRHLALLLVDESVGGQQGQFVCFQMRTSSGGAELLWYEDGGGNEYGLVLDGENAVLWVFDHECPYSPWALDDQPQDWPGMLDGLPQRLAAHLPIPDDRLPRRISACYWHSGERWHMGRPEPAADAPGGYLSDPQGVGGLIGPLLDVEGQGIAVMVEEYYELPDRRNAARALAALVESGEPVTEAALAALAPVDGAAAMFARAEQLGLAGN